MHGKTLAEELRGVVNLMHKRVLAVLEFTQETEGSFRLVAIRMFAQLMTA